MSDCHGDKEVNYAKLDIAYYKGDHEVMNGVGLKDKREVYNHNVGTGNQFQVVLFNDDHNAFDYVIKCLMEIFRHPLSLAQKITIEAHSKGKTIAQVETKSKAILHTKQLISAGLKARVEEI